MDELSWSVQGLTDYDLSVKLYDVSQDKTFKKVDFSVNCLQTIPDFKQHKQFECVEVLYLYSNKIENLDGQRLPCDVKVLYVSTNHVSELVDMSGCHRLEVLRLASNRICTFNPRHLPENIQVLDMQYNQLTDWPDISHCHKLRELDLSRNQITDLDPHTLPLDIEVLWMSGNKLTEIKDFSHHKKLQTLYLTCNQITDLDPHTLPLDTEKLDISQNKLTEIKDFSYHKKLQVLNLSGNKITKIYDTNRDMSFWEIDTFDETFFHNEHGYNQLLACHLLTDELREPPQEVFTRGPQSVQTYFKDLTLSKRVRHSRKRQVFYVMMHIRHSSISGVLPHSNVICISLLILV